MFLMQNNLSNMIRAANMTKREVAALKGITPENLSRQVNGHTNITLRDAEEYAKIFELHPAEIMFVQSLSSCLRIGGWTTSNNPISTMKAPTMR